MACPEDCRISREKDGLPSFSPLCDVPTVGQMRTCDLQGSPIVCAVQRAAYERVLGGLSRRSMTCEVSSAKRGMTDAAA